MRSIFKKTSRSFKIYLLTNRRRSNIKPITFTTPIQTTRKRSLLCMTVSKPTCQTTTSTWSLQTRKSHFGLSFLSISLTAARSSCHRRLSAETHIVALSKCHLTMHRIFTSQSISYLVSVKISQTRNKWSSRSHPQFSLSAIHLKDRLLNTAMMRTSQESLILALTKKTSCGCNQ